MAAAHLKAPEQFVMPGCGKAVWQTLQQARRVMCRMNPGSGCSDIGQGVLNAYRCKRCDGYHIGHKRIHK